VQRRRITVVGLVAVDPDTRTFEHRNELLAVARGRALEQFAEGGRFVAVVGAAGCFARLGEQAEPDVQRCSS
jgi:hypothetical protein